ncbi:glutamate formimidoyltransferase [Acetobacteroides hydrogenigenes]|uniref:Formimidoyltransferase-cyclodeaminase n=1 Tax=Acetobacteroides hydrogenigenes TaxID=979970 RepID=A0A4R2ECY5_9BACT|nr:glutamate formimidoyltransferase [Acetobacteroides hydrogenigenes]TCN66698.1 glutamate formiminotransferase/formiminotetrahydrofolate cyclodeaminase [Acetobacteroides hydrogenigenes]
MNLKLIECVPNFSEGNDMGIIKQITDEIESVEGVKLLDVDPGKATNRTVVTFVGTPDEVCEAAFRAAKRAKELIDMSKHQGAHPRFGATDVLPLIPVANITMEEVVEYARKLAKRMGDELQYPIYCYESAAFEPKRQNLAFCRSGEYEALPEKMTKPEWKPDFGPATFVPQTGATAVGARNFLIAVNFNLNTTSTRRANAIAFDVREKGRPVREGNPITGKKKLDENGKEIWTPGTLKGTKAIGWFIDEYGIAQVSMNITDINQTPLHLAFEEVKKRADERGLRVTGTEIVGLVPASVIMDAGKYFLAKQQRSAGIADEEIIKIAVKSMGLDELYPFDPQKKIIELMVKDQKKQLVDMTVTGFANETASESPAPGGGSIAAYMGALGAALGTMVANLSAHKPGWDDRWKEFSDVAEKGKAYMDQLLKMVDEDTNAFNRIMDALSLPKKTDEDKAARKKAIQDATKYAAEVPLKTMELCYNSMEVMLEMAEKGNPNSVSDAGVGAIAARGGVYGAYLNVCINAKGIEDLEFAKDLENRANVLLRKALELESEILNRVMAVISK